MKIEDQVCSLELAKKLKELGVKKKSLFYWSYYKYDNSWNIDWAECLTSIDNCYSAFTVAELGELLPDYFYSEKDNICPEPIWSCRTFLFKDEIFHVGKTEADCRAKMLINLIERIK